MMSSWTILALWATTIWMSAVNIVLLHRNHLAMNSRLTELMEAQGKVREAVGFKAGKEDHLEGLRKADAVLDDESKHGR